MKAPRFISAVAGIALAIASVAPLTANAGIKYWDNPAYKAFDVGDYVPGAVWNLDGICNNGADQPHSTTITTWKNLGSSGADNDVWIRYQKSSGGWANSSAPASLDPVDGVKLGSWTENGFKFTGDSEWRASGSGSVARIDTGTNYTIQVLVNATASGQTKAVPYLMSVQKDHFAFYIDKAKSRFYWKTQDATTSNHPFISGNDLGYATAILNWTDKTATFFSGTTIPTSGDGFRQFASVSGKTDNGYCICGYTGNDGQFVGTINFYRYYKRVLSNEELAWNRVVDEARYFNRTAPLPITNVVVATSVVGATGAEPAGNYAVDGRHTFIAPAIVNVGGIDYVCTGYTVETRNGDDWSAPIFHTGALYQPCAFLAKDADCVRLTWQWAKAAGLANLGYTVHDYVWDGLEVFYDGICNVGTNLPHSYTTVNWANLGSKGGVNDLFVQRLNAAGTAWETAANLDPVGNRDPGYWTEKGFRIDAESRFRCNSPGGFAVGTNYSLQMLVDAKASNQPNNNYAYLLGANNNKFSLRLRKSEGKLLWKYETGSNDYPYMSGDKFGYLTAIMRDANKQTLFSGTTEPTSGNGYRQDTACAYSENGFALGGYSQQGVDNLFVGTLKNFRQYSRALTAAELAQNRKVDDWRYFGIPDTPNVVVQSTIPYLRGDEPDGSYAVDGSHVFTAPASVTVKGIAYACDGYIVETREGSTWVGATSYVGNSYTYTVGESPALVRLTWKWKATHGIRTAADYSFADYSQAGLLWNYDGIYNAGIGTHDSSATTWKNLGSGGSAYDLSWNGETTTGEWAEDGYIFRGGPRFRGGGKVGPLKNYTLQTLVDADISSQTNSSSKFSYIMNAYDNYFNMSFVSPSYDGSAASAICWKTENGTTFMYFHAKDNHYDYATAMMDYDNKKAMMFPDTSIPTEYVEYGPYGKQRLFHQYGSVTSKETTGYGLGNRNNNGTEGLVGTLKNFRYYDRVLTEEEIVRNRNVDAVRYFGALGVTNVVVEVADGDTFNCNPAPGAYFVEGSYTFTASPSEIDGSLPNKVRVETLAADGSVSGIEDVEGTSYTYVVGTSPAKVRIQFRKKNPFTIIVK